MKEPHEIATELAGSIGARLPWGDACRWDYSNDAMGATIGCITVTDNLGHPVVSMGLKHMTPGEARAVLRALAGTIAGKPR